MPNKSEKTTVNEKLRASRTSTDLRTNADDITAMFKDKKEAFRNTYGIRQEVHIPEHKKNPLLHYCIVTADEVGKFLDRGYRIDNKLNGQISDEMIGKANATGTVPNFGSGQDRAVYMCCPKEWVKDKEKNMSDERNRREKQMLSPGSKTKPDATGISGVSKQIEIQPKE